MENVVRWGIVGPGNIARKFAKAIQNVDKAELVAVASRREETGRAFADTYQIPNVFVGYEEMAKSPLVDAVYIATPHPFHKPCAELFLNAKKHVLCEKPVCVNAKQAQALMECARKNQVFFMEAMWTRFLPSIAEAVKIAKSGEIGDIRGIQADFCYSVTPMQEGKLYDNAMAGGSLLDVGVYGLHFAALFLGNNPKTIQAIADVRNGVDCQTSILMQYENGAIATVSSAIDTKKPETGYIYGTKGYIKMPCFYGGKELFVSTNQQERHIVKPGIGDGFEEEIYEACRCIQMGKTQSDILPMAESIKILEQMDDIRGQIGLAYPFDAKCLESNEK